MSKATKSEAEVRAFANRLNILIRGGKLSIEESRRFLQRFKDGEIDTIPRALETEDRVSEDATLVRDGKVLPTMSELMTNDDISSPSSSTAGDVDNGSSPQEPIATVPTPTSSPTPRNTMPASSGRGSTDDENEVVWPTVPYDPRWYSSKQRPDGKPAKSRRDRVADLRSTVRTLSCMLFGRAGRGRSYDNERRRIVGPYILRPDGAVPSNKNILQVKALIEILIDSTDALDKLLKDNEKF